MLIFMAHNLKVIFFITFIDQRTRRTIHARMNVASEADISGISINLTKFKFGREIESSEIKP